MRYLLIALTVLLSIACGATATVRPATVSAPPIATDAPTEPIGLEFTGHGNQATALFELRAGLARFESTHDGRSNFIVNLLDAQGNWIGMPANAIGGGDSSKAIRINANGDYLLNILADGNWSIVVLQ